MVNVIEVTTSCIACKVMNIHDMATQIRNALPSDAEVLPVKQIADAQMGTLRKIMGFTTVIYLVVLGLCAFLLMNYVSASIDERRREIGMLMAMGMNPRTLQAIFTGKVLALAAVGGLLGYLVGSGLSKVLGPAVADTKVSPVFSLLPVGLALALALALLSSIVPARRLSRLEPVEALREI
jgi:putative ABC transport system permease protein